MKNQQFSYNELLDMGRADYPRIIITDEVAFDLAKKEEGE